jgi:hypothetical protein
MSIIRKVSAAFQPSVCRVGIESRSKQGQESPDGKLIQNRVYVRRPGLRSEEQQSAAEWDRSLAAAGVWDQIMDAVCRL